MFFGRAGGPKFEKNWCVSVCFFGGGGGGGGEREMHNFPSLEQPVMITIMNFRANKTI